MVGRAEIHTGLGLGVLEPTPTRLETRAPHDDVAYLDAFRLTVVAVFLDGVVDALGTRAAAYAPVRNLGLVALWDDGSASSKSTTRVLAARSGTSTDPLGSYNQVSQRSSDKRCNAPVLFLSTSGDGVGLWQCSTSSSGSS